MAYLYKVDGSVEKIELKKTPESYTEIVRQDVMIFDDERIDIRYDLRLSSSGYHHVARTNRNKTFSGDVIVFACKHISTSLWHRTDCIDVDMLCDKHVYDSLIALHRVSVYLYSKTLP